MKKLLLLLAIMLMNIGCIAQKKIIETQQSTTTAKVETYIKIDTFTKVTKETKTSTVPEAHTSISVAIDAVKQLPEGASFVSKESRATVIIKYSRDTITVDAICDSLQRLVSFYESEINSYKSNESDNNTQYIHDSKTEITQKNTSIFSILRWFLLGVGAGGIAFSCLIGSNIIKSINITQIIEKIKKIFKK
ncbi:MAG: hypothetical protein LBQ28_09205 [Prevotellaceae bacterium]|jgi:hypothetical protein|nr:hypothetical protein [Prevotellaceae bacterium]